MVVMAIPFLVEGWHAPTGRSDLGRSDLFTGLNGQTIPGGCREILGPGRRKQFQHNRIGINRLESQAGTQASRPYGTIPLPSGMGAEKLYRHSPWMVLRASIVLAAADGMDNAAIARDLGLSLNMVIKWRKRFFEEGMNGLKDRKRSGRPRSFSPSGDHRGQGTGL